MIPLTWKSNRDFWLSSGFFMITFNWVHALNFDLGKLYRQFNFLQSIFCALLLVGRIRFIRIYLNAFSSEHLEEHCCELPLLIFNYILIEFYWIIYMSVDRISVLDKQFDSKFFDLKFELTEVCLAASQSFRISYHQIEKKEPF